MILVTLGTQEESFGTDVSSVGKNAEAEAKLPYARVGESP